MKRIFFSVACITASVAAQGVSMPEPYASIKEVPFDDHGWFYNAEPLAQHLSERQPEVIVELGSWLGKSTRFLASHVKEWGGKLYAIDHWMGSNEKPHLRDPRLKRIYHIFLSNVRHAGLTDTIIPIRMKTLEAAKALDVMADMIYVDASHDRDSVYADIRAWLPHLKEGGLMCGDDFGRQSVKAAVYQVAKEDGFEVKSHGRAFWWFEPKDFADANSDCA